MKKIFLLFFSVIVMAFSLLSGYANADQSNKEPWGDLVVVLPSLGSEVWSPDVGQTNDHAILMHISDNFINWPMDNQDPGKYYPGLAKSWTISPDGLTYDFYLNKGIKWHEDWGEFTAEDAKYSLIKIGAEGSTNQRSHTFHENGDFVESYNVIDPYHLQIKMKKATPLMMNYLYVAMVCKKYFETVGHDKAIKHPIGTGPWKFSKYVPGNYIKLEAVKNHWRKTPHFQTLTYKSVPELSTRIAMLKSGEADIAIIPSERIDDIVATGLHIKQQPGSGFETVLLGGQMLPTREHYDPTVPWAEHQDEPADSEWNQRALKVRKALCLAINKDAMIETILNGAATPTPLHACPLDTPFTDPAIKPYPYDPVKAKALLAEAGYADGFAKPITLYQIKLPTNPEAGNIAMVVASDWNKIGIKTVLTPVDWPFIQDIDERRDTAWTAQVTGWSCQFEYWMNIFFTQHTKNGFNDGYENLELDPMLDACASAMDPEKRQELSRKLSRYIYDKYVECGICVKNTVYAMGPKTGDVWLQTRMRHVINGLENVTHAE